MSRPHAEQSHSELIAPPKRAWHDIFHNEITAWIVLITSLSLTLIAWSISRHYVGIHAQDNFNFAVEDARQKIIQRMLEYEQVLRGGVALFEASDEVTRIDWHNYVSTLKIDLYYPGIQGIGFASVLKPDEVARHETIIQANGFPDFAIHPTGKRDTYSSIDYLEPFDWRNRRAFGYDMFSESTRHSAMLYAMSTGNPALSGRVILVQETNQDVQAGFLMYLPLYRKGATIDTPEERRSNIIGFVYSPFRMHDLMQGILGAVPNNLSFEIYDSNTGSDDQLMYRSTHDDSGHTSETNMFDTHTTIELPGHTWHAHFHSTSSFEKELSSAQPAVIGVGGVAVDLLLFTILLSLSNQKKRIAIKNAKLIAIDAKLQEALHQVEQMAYYDSLTGLANRRMMDERLQQSMAMSHRDHHYRALLFLDLDKFKAVNDELGHDAGDQVLIEASRRMQGSIREVDITCRLGGDEFVIILEQLGKDYAVALQQTRNVTEKIRQALSYPYALEKEERICNPSIGITLFNDRESKLGQLLQLADEAMYAAKSEQGNIPHLAIRENDDIRIHPCT
ncbi:diguanylate cyclase [Mariprofundus erugo]|uniref:CHASE domain-containing protein n=1 Tax=Mariprofundus erugo TaxID=2528639 RepID=UPI0010FE68F2|nr:CHASE domain-containing protein [Mariprofundus erugo]TLS75955.1 diguanylate cyclase [Mariprofundus erugo]